MELPVEQSDNLIPVPFLNQIIYLRKISNDSYFIDHSEWNNGFSFNFMYCEIKVNYLNSIFKFVEEVNRNDYQNGYVLYLDNLFIPDFISRVSFNNCFVYNAEGKIIRKYLSSEYQSINDIIECKSNNDLFVFTYIDNKIEIIFNNRYYNFEKKYIIDFPCSDLYSNSFMIYAVFLDLIKSLIKYFVENNLDINDVVFTNNITYINNLLHSTTLDEPCYIHNHIPINSFKFAD